jgi:hypothetical protein
MGDQAPQTLREWMRRVDALISDLRRHTHPAMDPSSLPALEARVSVLEGQVGGLEEDVLALQGDVGTLQTDVAAVQASLSDLQVDLAALDLTVGDLGDEVDLLTGYINTLFNDVNDLQISVNTDLMEEEPFTVYDPGVANWAAQATQGWLRFGRMVQLTIFTQRNVSDQSAAFTYGTLPVGARPVSDLYFVLFNTSPGATGQDRRCHIATTGIVTINGNADTVVTVGNSLAGTATYIVPE